MPISKLGNKAQALPLSKRSLGSKKTLATKASQRLSRSLATDSVGRAPRRINASLSSSVSHRLYRGRLKQVTKPPKTVKDGSMSDGKATVGLFCI